jgi:hypothetical protein
MVAKVNAAVDAVIAEVSKDGSTRRMPHDLGKRLRELLDRRPELPWDEALVQIAAHQKCVKGERTTGMSKSRWMNEGRS